MRYGYMQNNHRLKARAERQIRKLFVECCCILLLAILFISL